MFFSEYGDFYLKNRKLNRLIFKIRPAVIYVLCIKLAEKKYKYFCK